MVCWISYDAFISWGDGNWQQSCPKRDFPSCRFFFASGTPWVCGHWKPCIRNGLHKLFITWVCMGLSQVFASKFQYQSKAMMILSYLSKRVSDTWAAPCSKNWCRERSFHGRHPKKDNSTWMREAPKFMRFCWCFVLEIPDIYIYKPTVHGRGVNKMGFQLPLPASTWLLSLDPKTKLRVSTKQSTSFKEGHHLGGWGLVAIC